MRYKLRKTEFARFCRRNEQFRIFRKMRGLYRFKLKGVMLKAMSKLVFVRKLFKLTR